MNTTAPTDLPELSEDRLDAMERRVFARIADDRKTQRTRRSRWWAGGAAAAAVVVVAAVISPYVASQVSGGVAFTASDESAVAPADVPSQVMPAAPGSVEGTSGSESADAGSTSDAAGLTAGGTREIAANASATVLVDDVADAAREIGADAEARGGYVESVNVDSTEEVLTEPGAATDSMIAPYPYPYPNGGGWITVRIPSEDLTDAVAALDRVGEVTTSNIGRQDVTEQAVDLRARVAASEASVGRLTELIAQAESVADLIAAESALAERQATLDSDRQQLESLENTVALSTMSVQLTPRTPTVEADPAGFGDGIAAGWNGLVATLNGIVIAFGFLLPWIVVIGVIAAVVWGVVRLMRRARRPRPAPAVPDDPQT